MLTRYFVSTALLVLSVSSVVYARRNCDLQNLNYEHVDEKESVNISDLEAQLHGFEGIRLASEKVRADHPENSGERMKLIETEYKRWLILKKLHPASPFMMLSKEVDELWHQHILFTKEYRKETAKFFGDYLDHVPNLKADAADAAVFNHAYFQVFGEAPSPSIWGVCDRSAHQGGSCG